MHSDGVMHSTKAQQNGDAGSPVQCVSIVYAGVSIYRC